MLFHKLSHKSNNSRSSLSSGVLCFRYKISLQNKCHCDCVSAGYMCICIFLFLYLYFVYVVYMCEKADTHQGDWRAGQSRAIYAAAALSPMPVWPFWMTAVMMMMMTMIMMMMMMVNYFQTWILKSANLWCSTRAFLQSVTLQRKFANSGWKKFKFAQICHSL